MANALFAKLQVKDGTANWTLGYSKNNCANKQRDAYAIYYRQNPSASANKTNPGGGSEIYCSNQSLNALTFIRLTMALSASLTCSCSTIFLLK